MSTEPLRPSLTRTVGAAILATRLTGGYTQDQLAEAAEIHAMAISRIERGTQDDVGIVTLGKIASGLTKLGSSTSIESLLVLAERWLTRLVEMDTSGRLSHLKHLNGKTIISLLTTQDQTP